MVYTLATTHRLLVTQLSLWFVYFLSSGHHRHMANMPGELISEQAVKLPWENQANRSPQPTSNLSKVTETNTSFRQAIALHVPQSDLLQHNATIIDYCYGENPR